MARHIFTKWPGGMGGGFWIARCLISREGKVPNWAFTYICTSKRQASFTVIESWTLHMQGGDQTSKIKNWQQTRILYAEQKPYSWWESNPRPIACKASVITATPQLLVKTPKIIGKKLSFILSITQLCSVAHNCKNLSGTKLKFCLVQNFGMHLWICSWTSFWNFALLQY